MRTPAEKQANRTGRAAGARSASGTTIERPDLVERLVAARPARVIGVCAPAGYGKSTLVELWEARDERQFTWLVVQPAHNDPPELRIALDQSLGILGCRSTIPDHAGSPAANATGDGSGIPAGVLVIEDLHLLESTALNALAETIGRVPSGVQVAVTSRDPEVLRSLGEGVVCPLDGTSLAMSASQLAAILASHGVDLADRNLDPLLQELAGWPVAARLAALAIDSEFQTGTDPASRLATLVEEYVTEQLLAGVDANLLNYLRDCSILEQLDPSQTDRLLKRHDSESLLIGAERTLGPLVARTGNGAAWSCNPLVRKALHADLVRSSPIRATELTSQATSLLEGAGDLDAAVRLASQGGDSQRVGALLLTSSLDLAATGELDRLVALLEVADARGGERTPELTVALVWSELLAGHGSAAAGASHELRGADLDHAVAVGPTTLGVALTATRAFAQMNGLDGLLEACGHVRGAAGPRDNPWWGLATLLEGAAYSMLGLAGPARARLASARSEMGYLPAFDAIIGAHLALLALDEDDFERARGELNRAGATVRRFRLEGFPAAHPVFSAQALFAAREGDISALHTSSRAAHRLLDRLGDLMPMGRMFSYLLLARASLAVGDRNMASTFVEEAHRACRQDSTAGPLVDQLNSLNAELMEPVAVAADLREIAVVTPAELKVLGLLPTHMSLREIADELAISRHTAKSQAISVYRKLGVSSRGDAVEAAAARGLVPSAQSTAKPAT